MVDMTNIQEPCYGEQHHVPANTFSHHLHGKLFAANARTNKGSVTSSIFHLASPQNRCCFVNGGRIPLADFRQSRLCF